MLCLSLALGTTLVLKQMFTFSLDLECLHFLKIASMLNQRMADWDLVVSHPSELPSESEQVITVSILH